MSRDHADYALERYYRLKAAGICTACGKRPARPGRTRCAECAAKHSRASIASQSARNAQRRAPCHPGYACLDCEKEVCEYHGAATTEEIKMQTMWDGGF